MRTWVRVVGLDFMTLSGLPKWTWLFAITR